MSKPKKRDRHERLMQRRLALQKAANKSDAYTTNILLEAIDYLYFEVDLLIFEVEELKKQRRSRNQSVLLEGDSFTSSHPRRVTR